MRAHQVWTDQFLASLRKRQGPRRFRDERWLGDHEFVPTTPTRPSTSRSRGKVGAHRAVLQVSGRQVERTVFSEWPNAFWIEVLAILEDGGPSACPMSQAGVSPRLREKAASAVLFTELLANHAVAALVCGAPAGCAAPSPGGLSGAGQEGISTREGRHTPAARATAVNRGEGIAELTWRHKPVRQGSASEAPAARASLSGAETPVQNA